MTTTDANATYSLTPPPSPFPRINGVRPGTPCLFSLAASGQKPLRNLATPELLQNATLWRTTGDIRNNWASISQSGSSPDRSAPLLLRCDLRTLDAFADTFTARIRPHGVLLLHLRKDALSDASEIRSICGREESRTLWPEK